MASSSSERSNFDNDGPYKKMARLNGNVNRMNRTDLIKHLTKSELETNGTVDILRKRLKSHYKQSLLGVPNLCPFDYLCVIDFEATCEAGDQEYKHEIIEFPAVLVDAVNWNVVSEFHAYCRPVINPKLTEFCTLLTGITQEQVSGAKYFAQVLEEFHKWLEHHKLIGLGKKFPFALVTDGPWDVCRFLVTQCQNSQVPVPDYAVKWINIRKSFGGFYGTKWKNGGRNNLSGMLFTLGMEFEGRQHSGMDDTRNIVRILINLLKDGAVMKFNQELSDPENNNKRSETSKLRTITRAQEKGEDPNESLGVDPDTIGTEARLIPKIKNLKFN